MEWIREKDFYQQILVAPEPWHVTDVDLKLDAGRIEVLMSIPSSTEIQCPTCQVLCPRYDKRPRRWRHLDTWPIPDRSRSSIYVTIDKVRRDEHKRLNAQGNPILPGIKHDWLSAEHNVPTKRKSAFRELCDSLLKTAGAWMWKEAAACLWHYISRTWAKKGVGVSVTRGDPKPPRTDLESRNKERFKAAIYDHLGGLDLYPRIATS